MTTRIYFSRMAGDRRRRDGCRDDEAGRGSDDARRSQGDGGSDVERHAAHDLRGDDAGRRPRDQCIASARACERQLPHLSGRSIESVRQALEKVAADPEVKVSTLETRGPPSVVPPLTREIMAPIEKLSARIYPGVPVLPILQPGATDGQFLSPAGIPTYGINGLFLDPDLGGIHGLNERVRVQSLYDGRDFLYELVKIYAAQR